MPRFTIQQVNVPRNPARRQAAQAANRALRELTLATGVIAQCEALVHNMRNGLADYQWTEDEIRHNAFPNYDRLANRFGSNNIAYNYFRGAVGRAIYRFIVGVADELTIVETRRADIAERQLTSIYARALAALESDGDGEALDLLLELASQA